jgi:hydroxyethylthiazole kinase
MTNLNQINSSTELQNHLTAQELWQDVLAVRAQAPLVHSITNWVVINFNANVLLAMGASPVMAHACEEVADMANIAQALVLNIGTLTADKVQAMLLAQKQAHSRAIPVVLDPVGAGATPYRNQALSEIIQSGPPGIIRGNGSEIMSVAGLSVTTKGVDSVMASDQSLDAALALAKRIEGVVCVSGETDYIIDAHGQVALLRNGDVWMTKVTGVGCSATALIGAFAAVQFDAWRATTAAMAYWGVVGEVAAEQTRALGAGVGTYATKLLDVTHNLDEQTFVQRLNISFNRMEA